MPENKDLNGFMIAAPHSGSGKTVITLGIIRALRDAGIPVGSAKAGPDFIDPAFHAVASGNPCVNLDPWAMREDLIRELAAQQQGLGCLVVEAMMGLFDGAADGCGSAADLAQMLDLPVVLVVDAAKQSHSIAALVRGFRDHRPTCVIAGIILNRVGSPRHEAMLREALQSIDMPVLGAVPRDEKMALPERHLGLVQAGEHSNLEVFVSKMAPFLSKNIDISGISKLKMGERIAFSPVKRPFLAKQKLAVGRDDAFAFSYPHLLSGWREQGVELIPFSPLGDEAPAPDCDAIFLPGGYPELHAGRLAANARFLGGLKAAAERGALIYGECGGFMVLGEALVDADGNRHTMANLLPLVTSFEKRKLHLGYRLATPLHPLPFGEPADTLTAHEFHYSSVVEEGKADRLFAIRDARDEELGECGLKRDNVMGSYLHLIDRRERA